MELDSLVRFAGVVNKNGELISGGQKDNVENLLLPEEVKMSIHYALQRRDSYTNLEYKIGDEKSSVTEYEKVTLISIPINHNDLFLSSIEPDSDHYKIINHVCSFLKSLSD